MLVQSDCCPVILLTEIHCGLHALYIWLLKCQFDVVTNRRRLFYYGNQWIKHSTALIKWRKNRNIYPAQNPEPKINQQSNTQPPTKYINTTNNQQPTTNPLLQLSWRKPKRRNKIFPMTRMVEQMIELKGKERRRRCIDYFVQGCKLASFFPNFDR